MRRGVTKDGIEDAFVLRREMQDDDKSHAALRRHRLEKLLQRRDAPRRTAQADDRQHFISVRGNDIVDLVLMILLDPIWSDRGQPFGSRRRSRSGRLSGFVHGWTLISTRKSNWHEFFVLV